MAGHGFLALGELVRDARHGARLLRKSPAFSLAVVLTLALGIGANTAIYSLTHAVLLRSLPYRDPGSLVKITFNNRGAGQVDVPFSVPELDDLRSHPDIFEDVSAAWPASVNLTGGREPQRLELLVVSPGYFAMLGTRPQIGRLFGPQDTAPGFAQVAVISDRVWRTSYGADPNVLGQVLRLDNDPYVIVGVLPPGFRHPGRTVARDVEVWGTAGYSADPFPKPTRGARIIPGAIGRLRSGLTAREAQIRLDALAASLRAGFPTDYPPGGRWSIEVQPLQEALVGGVRPMLLLLSAAAGLVVLIVVVNVANLLMARASVRRREVTVRLALGAGRLRIVRQLLTESLVLSLAAGAVGLAATAGVLDPGLRFVPQSVPRLNEVHLDGTVLLFAIGISVLTAFGFGLAPALQSTKVDLSTALRDGARGSSRGPGAARTGRVLTVAQLAPAVLLMVGAGLLFRTFRGLIEEEPGFDPSHVVTASLWLPVPNDPKTDAYSGAAPQAVFEHEVLRRLGALPGVEMAALTSSLPTAGDAITLPLGVETGRDASRKDLTAKAIRVSPGYFQVMRTPIVRGRGFTEEDAADKTQAAVVDESTARRYWGNRDAIGQRLRIGAGANVPWSTVVGIVKDVRHDGLDVDGLPHVYVSMYQRQGRILNVALRTSLPAAALDTDVRREVQSVDPDLPVYNVRAMREVVDLSLAPRRFSAELVGASAGLALLLSALGIYGLLSYLAAQRTSEIGVRIALGAQPSDIRRMILGHGARLAGAGILSGLTLAAVTVPLMASLVYGVRLYDVSVFALVPGILLLVAVAAGYVPARRASRVDPMVALRQE
jgi:predicted permease